MKMKSIQSSRRSSSHYRRRLFIITLVVAFALLGIRFIAPDTSTSFTRILFKPLWTVADHVGINFNTIGTHLASKQELEAENAELRKKLDEYHANILGLESLLQENYELTQAVYGEEGISTITTARILAKPPESAYDTILIDRGEKSGVKEGDLLFVRERAYLGRVMQVGASSAQARLASSPNVETQALILPANIHLTVSGLGGGAFHAELPIDIDINAGDSIVTRGAFPRVIAVVEDVSARPSDSFQTIRAVSPVNISGVSWVSVQHTDTLVEFNSETE